MAAKQIEVSPLERVRSSFRQLHQVANALNTSSDELGLAVAVWDEKLKELNLGVSAWVELSAGGEEPKWWKRKLGYARVKDRWGIAIASSSGDLRNPEHDTSDVVLFNDASRWLRLEAAARLPDLLEALMKQAQDVTRLIDKRTAEVRVLADGLVELATELQCEVPF